MFNKQDLSDAINDAHKELSNCRNMLFSDLAILETSKGVLQAKKAYAIGSGEYKDSASNEEGRKVWLLNYCSEEQAAVDHAEANVKQAELDLHHAVDNWDRLKMLVDLARE